MRTTTPYALNGHARVRLNCVVVAGGFSYLFHYFICLYFCRMRTWIFLRMPTALCACLVQPTLSATCSHSLVMVAPLSGAFGRRRGNKSCGFIGNIASCVAMRGYLWQFFSFPQAYTCISRPFHPWEWSEMACPFPLVYWSNHQWSRMRFHLQPLFSRGMLKFK